MPKDNLKDDSVVVVDTTLSPTDTSSKSATSTKLPPHLINIPYPKGPSHEKQASWLSYTTTTWFDNTLRTGWRKTLEMDDLDEMTPDRRSQPLADEFEKLWKAQQPTPSIFKTLLTMYKSFLPLGFFKVIGDVAIASTALAMQGLVGSIVRSQNDPNASSTIAYLYACLFIVLTMTSSLLLVNVMQKSTTVGTSVRGMLISLVYRKALRFSGQSRSRFSVGKVLNLVSTDITRIEMAFNQIHFIWTAPLWFIVTFILVIYIIGPAGLAGIATMLLSIPFQAFMIKRLMNLRVKTASVADDRIKVNTHPYGFAKLLASSWTVC
jgi:hypothetical protein